MPKTSFSHGPYNSIRYIFLPRVLRYLQFRKIFSLSTVISILVSNKKWNWLQNKTASNNLRSSKQISKTTHVLFRCYHTIGSLIWYILLLFDTKCHLITYISLNDLEYYQISQKYYNIQRSFHTKLNILIFEMI